MSQSLDRLLSLSPQKLALYAMGLQKKLEEQPAKSGGPIAICGAGLRLPGGVHDLESLWDLLESGRDPLGPVPEERWSSAEFYQPGPPVPGKMNVNEGGFLEDIDKFDPAFFGISPKEAVSMDPQQRLVLETSWRALENAAIAPDSLRGKKGGVFIGVASQDYSRLVAGPGGDLTLMDPHFGSGNGNSVIAGRLSYLLGLNGAAVAVDTACSSSLVAVHLACQSLRLGETDLALAGGVNVILSPAGHIALSQTGMLAPDGRCKAFDHRADGFVRSEGCGVVVIKRLGDAEAAGDPILGIIEGSAINQDGRSGSLTAPNGPSQEAVIKSALKDANLAPGQIGFLETHGTGTALGDPIEAQAAGNTYGKGRSDPIPLGALKSVTGHMETAAGIGGIAKLLAMFRKGQIPGTLHFERANPNIPFSTLGLEVSDAAKPWQTGKEPRRAAVSSFGYSGTNAHLILREPDVRPSEDGSDEAPSLLLLSARSEAALRGLAGGLARHLSDDQALQVQDMSRTLARGRALLPVRSAIAVASRDEAVEELSALSDGKGRIERAAGGGEPGIALLFTGQGAQYPAMAAELYESQSAFRAVIDRCDEAVRGRDGWTFAEKPLVTLLTGGAGAPDIGNTRYTQPALFAFETAMAALLKSWGLTPAMMIGHSIGEIAAAASAGMFTIEDGFCLAVERGQLMAALPSGAMAAVEAPPGELESAINELPGVEIAAINGPAKYTISGPEDAVDSAIEAFAAREWRARKLTVSHAFHSVMMDPAVGPLTEIAAGIDMTAPEIPVMSCLTGTWISPEDVRDPGRWGRHLRAPVDFAGGLTAMMEETPGILLEVGPQPHLLSLSGDCLAEMASEPALIPTARKDRSAQSMLLAAAGQIFEAGARLNWQKFDGTRHGRITDLPPTPFDRKSYWLPLEGTGPAGQSDGLLGEAVDTPLSARLYRSRLSSVRPIWIGDHVVAGKVLLPGAAIVEIAAAAARDVLGPVPVALQDLEISRAIDLTDSAGLDLQTVVLPGEDGGFDFRLYSRSDEGGFVEHAAARLRQTAGERNDQPSDDPRDQFPDEVPVDTIRAAQARLGLDLGTAFGGLIEARVGDGGALGIVQLPKPLKNEAFVIHPVLLDAALQVLGALDVGTGSKPMVPVGFSEIRVFEPAGSDLQVIARWCDKGALPSADLTVRDTAGRTVIEIEGLKFAPLENDGLAQIRDWMYRVTWRQVSADEGGLHLPGAETVMAALEEDIGARLDDPGLTAYLTFLDGIEIFAGLAVGKAFHELGAAWKGGDRIDPEGLARKLGIAPVRDRLFRRFLGILAERDILAHAGEVWIAQTALPSDDPASCLKKLRQDFPAQDAELSMLERCGNGLASVLQGGDPLTLLFPDGSHGEAEQIYSDTPVGTAIAEIAAETVAAVLPEGRPVRILEIGAGTGSLTRRVVTALGDRPYHYCYTDISPHFVEHGRTNWGDRPGFTFTLLDIEGGWDAGSLPFEHFDLILASNVLHATKDLSETIAAAKSLLSPTGGLVILEATARRSGADITFGLTDGWWRFEDVELRPDHPLLPRAGWRDLLQAAGFADPLFLPDGDGPLEEHVVIYTSAEAGENAACQVLIYPADGVSDDALIRGLESRGVTCMSGNPATPPDAVISLAALQQTGDPHETAVAVSVSLADHIRQLDENGWYPALPMICVARGGDQFEAGCEAARGVLRVAAREYPQLRLSLIEVDGDADDPFAPVAHAVTASDLPREMRCSDGQWSHPVIEAAGISDFAALAARDEPFRLDVQDRGSIANLGFELMERRTPGPGEIEIAVEAAGMNFRDVLNIMGLYPGEPAPPGEECAGRIAALGDGVEGFAAGDRVVAIARGSMASHATVPAEFVRKIPDGVSFAAAATVPVAYLTAAVSLLHLGKMKAGETVLIHAAAGGVGMAAVHLAHYAGAKVFATAHPSKWDALRSIGVEAMASSREPGFGKKVMDWTGGKGVDLVLNCLAEPFITESFAALARGGRFLEIGQTGIKSVEDVASARPDADYHIVMVADEVAKARAEIAALYDQVISSIWSGALPALPHKVVPAANAVEAFADMQAGRHTGRLVLDFSVAHGLRFASDGTYLVTGGLRGLGPLIGEWLAEKGAGKIVLIGRRDADEDGAARIKQMRSLGATVDCVQLDVTDRSGLEALFQRLDDQGVPIKGIIHSAGILADAPITGQDEETFRPVLDTKLGAAWTLHDLSLSRPVEQFILFSAGAALFGTPGQANHAAANTALDALAHYRRRLGLPALSINWGPWAEIGAVADGAVRAKFQQQGMDAISPRGGLQALEAAILSGETQQSVLPVNWPQFLDNFEPDETPYMIADLAAVRRKQRSATAAVSATPGVLAVTGENAAKTEIPGIRDKAGLAARLRDLAIETLGLDPETEIGDQLPLRDLGLDSLMVVDLRNRLAKEFSLSLPATLLFDYPTIAALVGFLGPQILTDDKTAPAAVAPVKSESHASDEKSIAIIGIGCRLPGGATDRHSYWQSLMDGVDGVTEVPPDRWDVDAWYDPDPDKPGKTYARHGGFIDGVDRFDAAFFAISPREASATDPQQRLLLECAWEAFEDAGLDPEALEGEPVGTFIGICGSDYLQLQMADGVAIGNDPYLATGNASSVAAGRIAYVLGLQGPALAIDTACSSSLVAAHLARKSLIDGECDLALAGGVNIMLEPGVAVNFARSRMLAKDGHCKSFDAEGDGFVRGEGCAVVVMKRLDDALADGDPVLAVIRGSAMNQDGRSAGLTAPNGPAQEKVIRAALKDAGIGPERIDFVETHGSGTSLGDPIEAGALGAVLAAEGREGPVQLGAVKTNLGHLEGAAGIAGLTKAALALRHRKIPPNLHFNSPNPHIDWDHLPLQVPVEARDWPARDDAKNHAGVSSFGFSGTNVHMILESPPAEAAGAPAMDGPFLLPLSARSGGALDALAEYVTAQDDLRALVPEACHRRAHLSHRLAIVSDGGVTEQVRGQVTPGKPPTVAFMFPGQGGQWQGMGQSLMTAEPVFGEHVREISDISVSLGGPDILTYLEGGAEGGTTGTVQPVLFAFEVALARLWMSWGIEPIAVIGHSMGEVAAGHIAGALSLADATRIIVTRSRLLERIEGQGAMLVTALAKDKAEEAIGPHGDKVSVAVVNSRASTVLSGDAAALDKIAAELEAAQVFCRKVNVDVASHSPQVDGLQEDLRAALAGLEAEAPEISFQSTVAPGEVPAFDADYWWRNLRQPVRFADGVEHLAEQGITHFLEIGPHPVLTGAAEETAGLPALASVERETGEKTALLKALARLYVDGLTPDWSHLAGKPSGLGRLPHYPWQKKRYWFESTGKQRGPEVSQEASPFLYETAWRPSQIKVDAPPLTGWKVLGDGPLSGEFESDAAGSRVLYIPDPGDFEKALFELKEIFASAPSDFRLVTSGAVELKAGDGPDPDAAALWALGRVALLEHPESSGGMIDVGGSDDPVSHVLAELAADDGEDQTLWHGRRRYVPRLVPRPAKPRVIPFKVTAETSWLITGGTGGIGLQLAEWLAAKGAGRIILASRSGKIADEAVFERLKSAATEVVVETADIADEKACRALIENAGPELTGIFHAAGQSNPARLAEVSEDDVSVVFAAKVRGTRNLERATEGLDIDWFVTFSTGGAVWGAEGQAVYAAASAAMDAAMIRRRAQGRHGLTVNWGWWGGSGMVGDEAADYYARMGFHPIPGEDALTILEQLMESDAGQAAAGNFDWPLYRSVQEARRRRPFFEEMEEAAERDIPAAEKGYLAAEFRDLPADERAEAMANALAAITADILGFGGQDEVEPDQGFFQMGMDSIMAVRLRQKLEAAFGVTLPPSVAFEFPNVTELGRHILSLIGLEGGGEAQEADNADDLIASIGAMDDAELDAMLSDIGDDTDEETKGRGDGS